MTNREPAIESRLHVDGNLEFRVVGSGPDAILFLHHGLGSMTTWRDLPERLTDATGWRCIAYSRRGHGWSDPLFTPYTPTFMHEEARGPLRRFMKEVEAMNLILVGHSDGASISLILTGDGFRPNGIVLIAPHVFVEPETISGIEAAVDEYENGDLSDRLARHHRDPDAVFGAWSRIWLDPAFRNWNIVDSLPAVTCPVLVIQAVDDEYGTMAQVEAIENGVAGRVERLILPDGGHAPHLAHRGRVVEAIADFASRVELR
jgi:pimeloyl-ACP methyl ester carboxylesterase